MILRYLTVVATVLLTASCATNVQKHFEGYENFHELQPDYFMVKIVTHDGKKLKATVYQPELAPGETAPVIIQTHGYGGWRTTRPISVWGHYILSGEAAIEAWKRNYWVISYSQRGWGGSQGKVSFLQQDKEVRDVSTIIDWVEKNIPRISRDEEGDIVLGMVGESFGAGVQMLASQNEPRIDTIVPIAGYYSVTEALAPDDHLKTGWSFTLAPVGIILSRFKHTEIWQWKFMRLLSGRMNDEAREAIDEMSVKPKCEQGKYPHADALFVQGYRDSLFSINDALANKACVENGNNEARLVAIQGGHILPWPIQKFRDMPPLFSTEDKIYCGNNPLYPPGMIVDWYDFKLKGIADADRNIPNYCLTLGYKSGLALDSFPDSTSHYEIPEIGVTTLFSGSLRYFYEPFDKFTALFIPRGYPKPADQQKIKGGWMRPVFVPLAVAEHDGYINGIPSAELSLEPGLMFTSVIFTAIGVRKSDGRYVDIVNEQFRPVRGAGQHNFEMPAISAELEAGDTIGFVAVGFSDQYYGNPTWAITRPSLKGSIELPDIVYW